MADDPALSAQPSPSPAALAPLEPVTAEPSPAVGVLSAVLALCLAAGVVVPFPAEGEAAVRTSAVALTLAAMVGALVVSGLAMRALLSERHLPWAAGLVTGAAALVACVQAVLTEQPGPVVTVMLVVTGAGLLPMARTAFIALLAVSAAGWGGATAGVLLTGGEGGAWVAPAVGVGCAVVLGILVQTRRTAGLTAVERARRAAEGLRVRDALTGAANRRGLDMVAVPMLENARRQGEAMHSLFIDIDDLRSVNAAVGRDDGNDVILAVADALRECVRSTDVVARWGGDQFVVIGPGTGMSPLELERRIRSTLVQAPAVPAAVWSPRVSVGSSTLVPWDDGDLDALLGRAQQDMNLRRSLRRQSALPQREPAVPAAPERTQVRPDAGEQTG